MSIESDTIAELRRMGRTVLTRKQWGSRRRPLYQTRRATRRFVGPADHAFAHITVTRRSGDFAADVRAIERIGYERFRTGVSYNWLIDRVTGAIAIGQPLDAAGAHTLNDKGVGGFPSNLNYWGHAIAWIGMPTDSISAEALESYAAIIAAEKEAGAMKPGARLYPHSKFAWKDCPCSQVRDRIPSIEARARALRSVSPATPRKSEEDPMPKFARVRKLGGGKKRVKRESIPVRDHNMQAEDLDLTREMAEQLNGLTEAVERLAAEVAELRGRD